MNTTRREFIQVSTAAGVGLMLLRGDRAYAFSQSIALQKWIQPLRGVSLPPYTTPGIPAAVPDALTTAAVDHYSIRADLYTEQLHPALPNTRLWGYADGAHGNVHRHLGGIIVAQRGRPVQMTMTNNLPATHLVPIDTTIPGANQAQNRIAVHLHGGFIPWIADGGPHDWFNPAGLHGLSFLNNSVSYPVPVTWAPGQAEYYWPMDLGARMLWYHDHAWGITRVNAYAGLATGLLIRDPSGCEGQLISQGLPGYVEGGGLEIPLVIQDKVFWNPAYDPAYSTYAPGANAGDLWYAYVYEKNRWRYSNSAKPMPTPSCIPEFYGDTMLANGTVYPQCSVAQQRYRIRLLNACQAKFLNLQLYYSDPNAPDGINLDPRTGVPLNTVGPPITVIGTEGGFLPAPVTVNTGTAATMAFNPVTFGGNLIVAPAERFDLLIDFSAVPLGSKLILYTDAPSPFPVGDPRNDYYYGSPNPTVTPPGFGPDTRQLLRFSVDTLNAFPEPPLTTVLGGLAMEPAGFDGLAQGVVPKTFANPKKNPWGVATVRMLTLNENFDLKNRLQQLIGSNVLQANGGFGMGYMDPPTEVIPAGTTEIWQIANLTGDTHPIHFHLVNVQIIARQPFSKFNGTPTYAAPPRPPDAYEAGWKETVRMNPGEVTTIIARFDLPSVPFAVPASPRTGGNEYVYHCHILEHEEHDMMRPLVVT